MKMKYTAFIMAALFAAAPASVAEWEPRGMCYVWSGSETAEAPEDMLRGTLYDYNRNERGAFFTYSGVYTSEKSSTVGRDLKTVLKARGTGAKNPTNSPDVHGQFAYTLRELVNGRYSILKRYYKYPMSVAASHFYLPPVKFKSLAAGLGEGSTGSDFIDEAVASPASGNKAKAYDDHISWFGVFRGRVIAPKSMTFRFFGAADDAIAVRFDEKLVLETGYFMPALYRGNGKHDKGCDWDYTKEYQKEVAAGKHPDKRDYVVRKLKSTPYCNEKFNGITGGHPIKVTEGESYPIEIIIGNNGGKTLYYLLTQEVTPGNDAPLQLFRTNDDTPTQPASGRVNSEKGPEYSADSPIWKVASKRRKKEKAKNKFRKLN